MMKKACASFAVLACACGITSSGSLVQTDTITVPARRSTVIVDGCTLDGWQLDTLGAPATKVVVHEVVLECLLPHADGTVTPVDPSAKAQLDSLVDRLHGMGYSVSLAADFVTDNGSVFDGTQTAKELADPAWVESVAKGIAAAASEADGVELDLEQLPATARASLTALVGEVAAKIRPAKKLGVFLPPSTTTPSDTPGGDAFDVATLAQYTDRFRVMTLDFSGNVQGPTIDPGWAVDAARFAQLSAGAATVDVAFPLYGNDFTTSASAPIRFTTWLEAVGLEDTYKVTAQRSSSQELVLDYTDDALQKHELWYDDAQSTLVTLAAWDTKTLPPEVGVVFYGLGAEDPALWGAIARATK